MTTNTFIPASMSWDLRVPTPYRPVIYQVDTTKLRLALHFEIGLASLPDSMREWVVSDPVSGRCVCRVQATYKGCPVSSRGLGPRDARVAAVATLDALVQRVGADRLLAKVREAREAAK